MLISSWTVSKPLHSGSLIFYFNIFYTGKQTDISLKKVEKEMNRVVVLMWADMLRHQTGDLGPKSFQHFTALISLGPACIHQDTVLFTRSHTNCN